MKTNTNVNVGNKIPTGKNMKKYFKTKISKSQIQPNGIDLTVDKIYETRMPLILYKEMKIAPTLHEKEPNNERWELTKGKYIVEWKEIIEIPNNMVGILLPRSTLIRYGNYIAGALWDRGYHGKGRSLLAVNKFGLSISKGTRLAQLILLPAEEDNEKYNGQYQGEGEK